MLILIDPADAEEMARAKALHARMVARAIAMDGTSTGEHGIGLGKIPYLADELGEAVDVMRSIKAALDPKGLMNPGKIFATGARA
jgi:D-lactate dehydrogenase (cytochrome)